MHSKDFEIENPKNIEQSATNQKNRRFRKRLQLAAVRRPNIVTQSRLVRDHHNQVSAGLADSVQQDIVHVREGSWAIIILWLA